jgi:hypothetical protein
MARTDRAFSGYDGHRVVLPVVKDHVAFYPDRVDAIEVHRVG